MAFVEITPPSKLLAGIGTGVRISVTERLGLRVSLAGEALAAILAGRSVESHDAASGASTGAPRVGACAGAGMAAEARLPVGGVGYVATEVLGLAPRAAVPLTLEQLAAKFAALAEPLRLPPLPPELLAI